MGSELREPDGTLDAEKRHHRALLSVVTAGERGGRLSVLPVSVCLSSIAQYVFCPAFKGAMRLRQRITSRNSRSLFGPLPSSPSQLPSPSLTEAVLVSWRNRRWS